MSAAFAGVEDYRAKVEITSFKENGSSEIQRFLYSFQKPLRIRLDFESPHPGMIMIYPDESGKVIVKHSGLLGFMTFHLSPDNRLLQVSPGQRIDQTDMGLLIRNIARSLRDQRRGPVVTSEEDGYAQIRVMAADHFRPGIVTAYRFFVDEKVWLPVKVEESTPGGRPERIITFKNLELNKGFPEGFFREGGRADGAK
jgi:outer membrane lipoprotein-sorting protein